MSLGNGEENYFYQSFDEKPDPPHQPLFLKPVLDSLRSDPTVRRVLDAGCGDGNFAESLAVEGYTVFGIDLSESGIRKAQSRGVGKFERSSLYESFVAPFPGVDEFDAIVSVEVIEHLYSPRSFVAQAMKSLRPGGLLIVTTPYWGYLKSVALAVTNRLDRTLTALWDGGHIKHWSRKTLTTLMEEQGFEFVSFSGDSVRPIPFLWKGMVMTFRKPNPPARAS